MMQCCNSLAERPDVCETCNIDVLFRTTIDEVWWWLANTRGDNQEGIEL